MKVLVTGVKGQLGYDVVKRLHVLGIECKGVDIEDFDLTDEAAVLNGICAYQPDAVVHCAAYTAVDKAEENRDLCYRVNVLGTRNVAMACREIDAKMIYISTDYVFNGQGEAAFVPEDKKEPINYYGETKALGEEEVTPFKQIFYCAHFLGIWHKRRQFCKNDASFRQGKGRINSGGGSDWLAHLYL